MVFADSHEALTSLRPLLERRENLRRLRIVSTGEVARRRIAKKTSTLKSLASMLELFTAFDLLLLDLFKQRLSSFFPVLVNSAFNHVNS